MRATTSRDSHSKLLICEKVDSLPLSLLLVVVVGRRDSGGLASSWCRDVGDVETLLLEGLFLLPQTCLCDGLRG